jgi:aminopeptidase
MLPDFAGSLRALAHLIVRVGLNLQKGQRLLIAEPYELQGVARGAEVLVEAVKAAALRAGAPDITVIWGDGGRLRQFVERKDWRGFGREIGANTQLLHEYVRQRDAVLFLQSSHLELMHGVAADGVNEFRHIVWQHFGPIAQQLTAGATNWTVASAPIPTWARAVYADLPSAQQLAALWTDVFAAMRVNDPDPVVAWQMHLEQLRRHADRLNEEHLATLHYRGGGTDLTVALPPEHLWCTACLTTKSGLPFVANLPTEEIFTVPSKDSAVGVACVSRPINYGGTVIDGIELEFKRGRVVRARARTGEELLKRLLETDDGASRLGEVALVPEETALGRSGRLFFNPLLDENATSHIALGEGYAFCLRSPNLAALNRSLIHVDLPLDSRSAIETGVR